MSTRLYLEASGAPPLSPTFGGWTSTTNADRVLMGTTPLGTVTAAKGESRSPSNGDTILERQFVSAPLAVGQVFTITNTLTGQIRCKETSGTNNVMGRILVRVMGSDGTTVRATLRTGASTASEFNTALRNVTFSTTLSAGYVTLNAGDVLVVEIGWGAGQTTTMTTTMSFGTDGASDLPVDETTTTALKPWVEFQDTITFASAGTNWAPMLGSQWNRLIQGTP